MSEPRRHDVLFVASAALLARAATVAWAATRIPPAADGVYYQKLAERLASGEGYTWLWPDGVVTYAAHYPPGYSGMLALLYRAFGVAPWLAMAWNAALGVLGVVAIFALASFAMPRRAALAAGVLAALDPALVMYTPALMTEGVTASLVAIAAWCAAESARREGRARGIAMSSLVGVLGVATLVRPQCLLLAPFFGWLAVGSPVPRARAFGAIATTLGALAVVLPWTVRNCARMGRCALVSVNGGWNLLIGAAPEATGHWSPIDVPAACRAVFDEAGKDACFGEAARGMIAAHPWRWLSLVPAKLSATFDYAGAAPWYLHEANPAAFPWEAKIVLGGLETVVHRLMLVAALLALGFRAGPTSPLRRAIAITGCVAALWAASGRGHRGGDLAHLAIVALVLSFGRRMRELPVLHLAAAAVIATTALVHAVFFGAGRYGLVAFPFVAAISGALLTELAPSGDTSRHAAD